MAKVLSPELIVAADNAGIAADLRTFLVKQEILTLQDFGLIAATESDFAKEIIEVAAAAGCKFEMKDKVATRKLWLVCRKLIDMKPVAAPPVVDQDAPLTEIEISDLKGLWSKLHGFVLPEAWILSPGLVGRISRQVTCSPPQLEVILAESLRPRSCSEKTSGAMFQVLVPGKQTETQVILADSVTRPVEMYMRCRAFFVSAAYVSIKHPQFCDFQTALFASDKILGFVTQSFGGCSAPMSFYVTAWAGTIHHFCEEIRLHGKTLNECIKNTGEWQHKWTNWQNPAGNSGGGQNASADLPKGLQDEVDKMRIALKDWQTRFDTSQREFNAHKRNHIADKYGTHGNGGGNGGAKGGGKPHGKPNKGAGRGNGGGDKRGRDEYEKGRSDRQKRSPNRNGGNNRR